ncbi:hypothetical protein GGQ86_003461 [Xanthobacter flavus]|uniref:Uncharacterized protein n=1 Tax=Xanthobacter flavus TaxID=281 RepID=A0A9W6FMU4_XANFL|nr:hypothetical protein [Xanthobacter flavus]MBN8914623.1 hypothetical protein [Hyphomicrobiales bacterium]MDR6334971.1 hypothetical protein [Xanthobacter flavus]GLI23807.1 hypothetical protein XFLAVUS301_34810 [Xanthobacter flavus]
MPSGTHALNLQPLVDGAPASVTPFPAHLARQSNLPRLADAQVAQRREETLVEELNRVLANIGRLSAPQESI